MKASLVSATSLAALLAFEAGPALAGPLVTLSSAPSETGSSCTNTGSASSCTLTFFALPNTASSQSQTVTATYTAGGTLSYAVTFNKAVTNPPYSGTAKGGTVNVSGGPETVTSNPYGFTGGTSAGSTGETAMASGSAKVTVANNTGKGSSQTSTITLLGTTVAPIEGVAVANAGDVLVHVNSAAATVTVNNTGHGNLSGLGSVSNLNGTVGGSSGLFNGSGGGVSLGDTSSTGFTYVFTPTQIGATSTSVSANFSNGDATGGNASNSANVTISGTGVAPIQNTTVSNSGNAGSTPNTGNVGFALVGVQTGTATISVLNSGNGNLDTTVAKSISNLNGTVGASGSSVFQGSGTSLSLNDGTTTSTSYSFNPTARGTASTAIVTTYSNGNSSGNNLSQTVTTALSGQGVAPVEGMTGGTAGFTLVGTSHTATVTVTNSGDGNLSGLGSISNLNGSVGGPPVGSTEFAGPSPNPTTVSLTDASSAKINYVYAPTTRGADSGTVTGTFSNGSADSLNRAHTNTAVVTGIGVAPIQSTQSVATGPTYVLVGTTGNLSFTVTNNGNGNLDTSLPTSVTNLNGTVGGPVGDAEFSGPSPNPNPLSLGDTSSTAVTFQFSPTLRGAVGAGTVTAAVTTSFSNGNASGSNAADAATTTLAGEGVAPVNAVSSVSPVFARVGGTTATASVTVANIGDGNLSGLGAASNLNGSISAPVGANWSPGSPNTPTTFSIADSTSSPSTTSNAFTFTYSSQAARGTSSAATVTIGLTNGSSDSTNSAQTVTPTLIGNTVGPQYQSFHTGNDTPVANAATTTTSTISWGTVSKAGSFQEMLQIANLTPDSDGGNALLTDLSIESFSITGADPTDFTLAGVNSPTGGFTPTVLTKGDSEFVFLDFDASGVPASDSALLTFQTDDDTTFGGLGNTYSYDLTANAISKVPEPSSVLLLSIGFGGLFFVRRRKINGRISGCDAS
jgi:hypothetical protein